MERPANLTDVEEFEEVLRLRVMVVRSRLCNKFINSPSSDERPCINMYLVDDDHYHATMSINGSNVLKPIPLILKPRF